MALSPSTSAYVEVVLGVSSVLTVPAMMGIPMTFRGMATSFAVTTAHCQDNENTAWEKYAGVDTLVILMGADNRVSVARQLMAAGKLVSMPAPFIERGTNPQERVVVSSQGEVADGTVVGGASCSHRDK